MDGYRGESCGHDSLSLHGSGTAWEWINDDIIFILGWQIPLNTSLKRMKLLILHTEAPRGSSNLWLARKYYNFTALFHFGDSWHALTEEPRHGSLQLMGLVSVFLMLYSAIWFRTRGRSVSISGHLQIRATMEES